MVGCQTAPRPQPKSLVLPASVDELIAAVAADSKRSDRETDSRIREQLAADAGRSADACIALEPRSAGCLYYHGIALGLEAKAHPTRAVSLLKTMLDALSGADAADPHYDQAGPARVKALVLVRAPGWPVGPGDAESGLAAAHRAVSLQPDYPPNVLALAEAQNKTGDSRGAQESYAHARALAQALPPGGDRDAWVREAERGMAGR
jgi:hypothetical protein